MSPTRVALVCPVPMPYTFPVLRLIADSNQIELNVFYSRRALMARGEAPDPGSFGFSHMFLADAGHVFAGSNVTEIDFNPGLPRALTRFDPQLVIVSGFVQPTAVLGVGWAAFRRRPYGLWVESHDLQRRPPLKRALRRGIVGPIVRRASVLLPTSEAAAASLEALGGARTRMLLFPHVPDPKFFHARNRADARASLRARLGISDETPIIVFVGRLVGAKGVEMILQAQHQLHQRTGAWLVVVGSGPLLDRLQSLRTPGVSFLGFLEPSDVGTILRASDVAVAPSLEESWGTFPLEAAACGCPIVASSAVPSARELVGRFGIGTLVPPGDSDALANALVELFADRALLAALSQRAPEAVSDFTPETAAASFLKGVRIGAGRAERA